MLRTSLIALSALALPVSAYSLPAIWETLDASAGPPLEAGQLAPGAANCGQHDPMAAELKMQFEEYPTAIGLLDEKTVMELFVSESGSWTMIATDTTEQSCVMAVGEGFESNLPIHEAVSRKLTSRPPDKSS